MGRKPDIPKQAQNLETKATHAAKRMGLETRRSVAQLSGAIVLEFHDPTIQDKEPLIAIIRPGSADISGALKIRSDDDIPTVAMALAAHFGLVCPSYYRPDAVAKRRAKAKSAADLREARYKESFRAMTVEIAALFDRPVIFPEILEAIDQRYGKIPMRLRGDLARSVEEELTKARAA